MRRRGAEGLKRRRKSSMRRRKSSMRRLGRRRRRSRRRSRKLEKGRESRRVTGRMGVVSHDGEEEEE